ncbi:hypothetical protein Dsin_002461 [Dipteronia sinensis]|uniref:Dolichyl-diphosphooligosaccharide--protein glycosyltransferase subunit KCP2 n=1 Tax=Dipteronia sinensis TaxID=43782 RepID=A0AAE0B745_9ROSI|nr:hypothetical protein Dsin_002461 [Dipteronia sinensis]
MYKSQQQHRVSKRHRFSFRVLQVGHFCPYRFQFIITLFRKSPSDWITVEPTLQRISGRHRDRDRARTDLFLKAMAGTGSSMLYSFLTFTVILSLQEMYRGKLASSELFTILGGFISSLLFLVSLTFIGNFQEASGMRTGWGAVLLAEAIALIAASTVHRVCITTCFLFSAGILYEVNKLSGMTLAKSESKTKRH